MSGATFEVDPSWPTIEELAVRLWGKVTGRYQGGNELRFGAKESKSVRIKELTWFDNETQEGGGYIRLWSQLYPGTPLPPRTGIPRPTPKPNGHDATGAGKPNGKHVPRDPNRPPVWEDVGPVQYDYHDATGTTVLQVYRTISGAPRFRQRSPNGTYRDGKPKWKYKVQHVPGHDTMLYHFPELLQSSHATVFITEGEKDCDNVIKLGLVATTNIGGAGKWRRENARWFLRKPVVILSDNDPQSVHQVTGEPLWHPDGRPVLVGQDHAEDVASALYGTAMSVKVLHLPGLPIKGDVSDWIEAGGTREELERLARDLDEWTPPPEPPPATDTDGPPVPPGGEPPPPDDPGRGRPDDLPTIACVRGELPRMVRQAEAALINAGVEIYQRHKLVRPIEEEYPAADNRVTHSAALQAFTPASLTKLLATVATFLKFNKKEDEWKKDDPPDKLVQIILDGKGDWTFPHIRGVLTCPTLRADGSVLTERGYDPVSRYYLATPSNLVMPPIPEAPTREDAEAALERLGALLERFPFENEAVDKAVAFCILMTQVLRCAMQVSPMLAVSATSPGSGKSFLIDLASAIALGRPCPVIPPGKDETETEKGIRTKLISGTPAFSIDNVYGGINLPLLNMATERTHISIRLFSVLEEVEVENSVVIYSNGNNMPIVDEQGRRTLRCCLDSGEERPEQRVFDVNPIDIVMADRGRYIADILIIARAYLGYLASGGERPDIPPMGDSHKTWSKLVREPLVWLGQEDPLKSQDLTRQDDPVSTRLGALVDAWHAAFDMGEMTLAEAAKYATTPPTLHADRDDPEQDEANTASYFTHRDRQEALLAVLRDGFAAGKDGVNAYALGMWLRRFEGRPVPGGLRFVKARDEDGKPRLKHSSQVWKLARDKVK